MALVTRRAIVGGVIGIIAAPAIVRASSLMPLRGEKLPPEMAGFEVVHATDGTIIIRLRYRIVGREAQIARDLFAESLPCHSAA